MVPALRPQPADLRAEHLRLRSPRTTSKATQRIYHAPGTLSFVSLPVVPLEVGMRQRRVVIETPVEEIVVMRRTLSLLVLAVVGSTALIAQSGSGVPKFEVDPCGRSPCPTTGRSARWPVWPSTSRITSGFCIGPQRSTPAGEAGGPPPPPLKPGTPAPSVIEFDQAGNALQAWGGPGTGYEWPVTNTACSSIRAATCG